MAVILPFAFEVGCEGFFGQVRMHVCVHLHTCACTRVHLGTGTAQCFEICYTFRDNKQTFFAEIVLYLNNPFGI